MNAVLIMERKTYPGVVWPVISHFALLVFLLLVPALGVGVYLRSVHDIQWASTGVPIGGMVVLAIASHLLLKAYYRSLPCPTCGRKNLPQSRSKDTDRWHLLTCENCGVEWETGLGESKTTEEIDSGGEVNDCRGSNQCTCKR